MFFVAESITEDPAEFRAAVARFIGALTARRPVRGGLHGGLGRVPGSGTHFPALPITPDDVEQHLTVLGVGELSVELLATKPPGAGWIRRNDRGHRFRQRTVGSAIRPESHGDPDTAAHP